MNLNNKLIASHSLKCRGITGEEDDRPLLEESDSTLILVNVYQSGETDVLCRYRTLGECNAPGLSSSKRGLCPYFNNAGRGRE